MEVVSLAGLANSFLPFFTALIIAFFCSMSGITGAFLLVPFQITILNINSPIVTPTNFLYNTLSIPGGLFKYIKDGKMNWLIALITLVPSIFGQSIGVFIRLNYLLDPVKFKFFVGLVLLLLAAKLLHKLLFEKKNSGAKKSEKSSIKNLSIKFGSVKYSFQDKEYSYNPVITATVGFLTGIIGGIYGIGGGAIISPFLVAAFNLSLQSIAGATLFVTFINSIFGILFYKFLFLFFNRPEFSFSPDLHLGIFMGSGGFLGVYLGARFQKYFKESFILWIIICSLLFISIDYIWLFIKNYL